MCFLANACQVTSVVCTRISLPGPQNVAASARLTPRTSHIRSALRSTHATEDTGNGASWGIPGEVVVLEGDKMVESGQEGSKTGLTDLVAPAGQPVGVQSW
jgi:hypothetical protein